MISPDNNTYLAALVLKARKEADGLWEPVALFDQIVAAGHYAKMCDTGTPDGHYVAAEVACSPQDLVPVEGELPLFRRAFSKEILRLGEKNSSVEAVAEEMQRRSA